MAIKYQRIQVKEDLTQVICNCDPECVEFRCVKCKKSFRSKPNQATCPCGSLYIEWVNYQKWREDHKH